MSDGQPTILIVDDDKDVRDSLSVLMEAEGYAVDTAEDGHRALETLRAKGAPSLVILDLRMPKMDGWQLRRELLRDKRFRRLPVLVVSSESNLSRAATELKASAYLRKPLRLDELIGLVRSVCGRRLAAGVT